MFSFYSSARNFFLSADKILCYRDKCTEPFVVFSCMPKMSRSTDAERIGVSGHTVEVPVLQQGYACNLSWFPWEHVKTVGN